MEHKHTFPSFTVDRRRCPCGVILCFSVKPGPKSNVICNLEKGHAAPCMNTHYPAAGTWVKKPEEPPMKIVVTHRGDDYHACLEGRSGIWARGNSQDGAIGYLIRINPDIFKIAVEC